MKYILDEAARDARMSVSDLCRLLPEVFWETNSVALVEEALRGLEDYATMKIVLGRSLLEKLKETVFARHEWPALARAVRKPMKFEFIFPDNGNSSDVKDSADA